MLRKALGALAGLVAGVLSIMLAQTISHKLYPPPPGFNPENREALEALMVTMPTGALLLVLFGYALGSLAGGFTAAKIGKHMIPALIVGGLLMLAGIANLAMLPHPTWFAVTNLLLFLPLAWVGGKLGAPREPTAGSPVTSSA